MLQRIATQLAALKFRPVGPLAAPALAALQRDLVKFPKDYREFLGETGGGAFEADVVCRVESAPPDIA